MGEVGEQVAAVDFYAALLDDDPVKLYEQAPCGYLSTAPDGMIVKVNRTFLTLTGYTREALVGRRLFSDLLTAGGRIYHETHYAPMLEMQGRVREIALDIVRADGRRLPVLVNSVLERDASGRPAMIRTAVFDATERRQYEVELLRAKQDAEAAEARAKALTRTLQQTLIPPSLPPIPGLDIAAAYHPSGGGDEVGGDFYDTFQIGDGDWAVVVGDVAGKGVEAAVITALARYTLRGAAVRSSAPSDALAALNEVLLQEPTERFCTVVVLRLRHDGAGWRGVVTCGGHALPLLVRPGQPAVEVGKPGSLIGALPDPALEDDDLRLAAGDTLVLYTDGVTEARRGQEFYGAEGLGQSVMAHGGGGTAPAQALADGVMDDVLAFQSYYPRDDIAVVAVRVPWPASEHEPERGVEPERGHEPEHGHEPEWTA